MLRIGVNTGEVVAARETDAGDFLITGDAVNVAARLQQHAEPGAILAGERTRRAVSAFRFADQQMIAVKGKREPIVGSVLLDRLAERRVARAPFLGRDHDLAQLDLVAQRAFGERRPQLVAITAPAGTGEAPPSPAWSRSSPVGCPTRARPSRQRNAYLTARRSRSFHSVG